LAPERIGFHAQSDQIVGAEVINGLFTYQRHDKLYFMGFVERGQDRNIGSSRLTETRDSIPKHGGHAICILKVGESGSVGPPPPIITGLAMHLRPHASGRVFQTRW